jgi:oligopeptide/dipeptide ABC transporter ATP-binding protein
MNETLLEVQNLRTAFLGEDGLAMAVDGVSLRVRAGTTLGLVGESGCGKSALALSILRLLPAPQGRVVEGRVLFGGEDLLQLEDSQLRRIRGKEIGMIFQEPMTSLNPVYPCGEQVAEVLRLHEGLSRKAARERAIELLNAVGIPDAARRVDDYPHQLSGGMRQRVMIAMAIACRPRLLIADEPTTALDLTIQQQILRLLASLQSELGMSLLHITHDLAVLAESAHEVAVMYAGRLAEVGPAAQIFSRPAHPYTLGLLACRPESVLPSGRLRVIGGSVPNPLDRGGGCRFAPRCPFARDRCHRESPPMREVGEGHEAACFESARVLQEGRWPDARAS